jgi:hypothetical protein
MYNKLFAKILDSSIWLEPIATRIVWLTFIAVMDEDGFVQFAGIGNVAQRAAVTREQAQEAIACLEAPDAESSDPDNDGRRVERVPGGWIVLNAAKHRDLVTRAVIKEQTRERVRRHRERVKRECNAPVTISRSGSGSEVLAEAPLATLAVQRDDGFDTFWSIYPKRVGKGDARKSWAKIIKSQQRVDTILAAVERQRTSKQWMRDGGRFIPNPATWLNQQRWDDDPDPDVPQLSDQTIRILSAGRGFGGGQHD